MLLCVAFFVLVCTFLCSQVNDKLIAAVDRCNGGTRTPENPSDNHGSINSKCDGQGVVVRTDMSDDV